MSAWATALLLAAAARKKANLTDDSEIVATVFQLAKKYRVTRLDADYHLGIKDPKALIKVFKETSVDDAWLKTAEKSLSDHEQSFALRLAVTGP